jgi:predicted Zn-dependent protease
VPAPSPRASLRGLALGVALALAAACGTTPRSEPPPAAPPARERELSTAHDDETVGKEEAERASAEIGLVEDAALVAYVEQIGRRLARHAPGYAFDYHFRIVDDAAPNAFALPGGFVFVSRGLLVLSNSEDELAGVIGHEIAHVALRHAAARQQVGGSGLMQAFRAPYLMGYSRDLERSADRVGQGLAGVAGYDPHGITRFLGSLDASERLRLGAPRLPSFFDTHPGTGERIADTAARASEIAWKRAPEIAGGRDAYVKRLDGLVAGDSARQGVFQGERFVHPDMGFTLRFPSGWEPRNTPLAVGALSPDRRGQVYLEHGGRGRDPAAAAEAWIQEASGSGVSVHSSEPIKLVGRDAQRVVGTAAGAGGLVAVHATFLPWRGHMLVLTGVSVSPERHEPLFVNVARSFRPMTPELLAGVRETRVRLARAQPGETIAALSQRTRNAWPVALLAVTNGVQPQHRFAGNELVKVGIEEPYRPAAEPPSKGEGGT